MILVPAERILKGQVPYKDFFSELAPGTFYIQALWFKLFGVHIWSARLPMLLVMAAIGGQIYYLTRLIIAGPASILPALVFTVAALTRWTIVSHHWYSLFFSFFGLIFLTAFLRERKLRWLPAAGTCVAAATACMQSKGALLILATVLVLLLDCACERNFGRKALRAGLAFMAPVAGLAAVAVVYFHSQGALGSWAFSNFSYLQQSYFPSEFHSPRHLSTSLWRDIQQLSGSFSMRVFGKVFGQVSWGLMIPLAGVIAAIQFWRARDHDRKAGRRHRLVLVFAIFGLALMMSEMHRFDLVHMMFGAPLLLILSCALLCDVPQGRLAFLRVASALSLCLVLYHLGLGASLAGREQRRHYPIQTRRGTVYQTAEKARHLQSLVDEIQGLVPAGGDVLLYPYSTMLYFLTATNNPTRYDYLLPGETTRRQFAEVIRFLETSQPPVPVVSFWKERRVTLRSAFPGISEEVWRHHPVESYLKRSSDRYRPLAESAGFTVFCAAIAGGR